MKKKNIVILTVLVMAIIPVAYAEQTSAQGTIEGEVIDGGLVGTLSLNPVTRIGTTNSTVEFMHATLTATFTTPDRDCIGFYGGTNINSVTTGGTFTLSCSDGTMIQGVLYGEHMDDGDNSFTYDAFVITPTPGPAGKDGLNGTNGTAGPQGPPGDTYYSSAFEDCNSKDSLVCSSSKQLKSEEYSCKPGFGLDTICLVGQCQLKRGIDSCTYGCENATCQAPLEWTSNTCSSWCRAGNDIPETPCNTWSNIRYYVETRHYCNWL